MKKVITTLLMALTTLTAVHASLKTDTFTTKSGKTVTITYIKHASIHIVYNGKQIQVDPVGDMVPITNYSTFPKADIILVTHEHNDHFDREAIGTLRKPSTLIYVNQSIYNIFHNGITVENGDSLDIEDDIQLVAVPAYNTTAGREQFHPKGRDNGYILILDGLRIYIAGDTEDIPEMANIKDIDIAFLPCNQPYTMTVDQLVKAAKTIKPKVLYPYHYTENIVHQVALQLVGSGINVRIHDNK